jgi:hypothetical protein
VTSAQITTAIKIIWWTTFGFNLLTGILNWISIRRHLKAARAMASWLNQLREEHEREVPR